TLLQTDEGSLVVQRLVEHLVPRKHVEVLALFPHVAQPRHDEAIRAEAEVVLPVGRGAPCRDLRWEIAFRVGIVPRHAEAEGLNPTFVHLARKTCAQGLIEGIAPPRIEFRFTLVTPGS